MVLMRYLLIFVVVMALFACTTTNNTKINSENRITIHSKDHVVFVRDPQNPYKSDQK